MAKCAHQNQLRKSDSFCWEADGVFVKTVQNHAAIVPRGRGWASSLSSPALTVPSRVRSLTHSALQMASIEVQRKGGRITGMIPHRVDLRTKGL